MAIQLIQRYILIQSAFSQMQRIKTKMLSGDLNRNLTQLQSTDFFHHFDVEN